MSVSPASSRRPLQQVLFSRDKHEWIVKVQVPTVTDKFETGRYLNGLSRDISVLEDHVQKHNLPFQTLPTLFRAKAIQLDIKAMNIGSQCSNSSLAHNEHLNTISDKPHLLLAHLAVHYGGFLNGGLMFAPRLAQNFGPDTIHLYQFEKPHELLAAFNRELEEYTKTLSPQEYEEFEKEVETAWAFIIELFDKDTRTSKCECIQRIWNRAKQYLSHLTIK